MAAYPIRMPRSGPGQLVAVVMVLLALAAGVLVSAGSEHHRHDHATAQPVASEHAHPVGEVPAHGHEHGHEWTPNLSPRVRLDGHAALVGIFVGRVSPAVPGLRVTPTVVAVGDVALSRLGVLRV